MSCDLPWQQPDLSIEEDILRTSAELPAIPGDLSRKVLDAAASAYRNNRLLYRLQIVTIAFVCVSFIGLLSTYYLALFRVGLGVSSMVAQETTPQSSDSGSGQLPAGGRLLSESGDAGVPPCDRRLPLADIAYGPVVNAAASPDDWALVDAFGDLQNSKSNVIRKFLWH